MAAVARSEQPLARRVAGQGLLLTLGHALAQALSFGRNAIIGHALSPTDFGIAAALTMILQLMEILTDVGADRLVVQAPDGDDPRLLANAHTTLVLRGALSALALYALSGPVASFFDIPQAADAFALLALAPAIKGFMHLDCRRAQRRLDNRPSLEVEICQQAVGLLAALPCLFLTGSHDAVVLLAILQAAATVAVSHLVAGCDYRLAADRAQLARIVRFGWPILVSALPVVAVYQGDRIIVGKLYGMEVLAAYSAAVMLTMVPCLLGVKVGQSLMLPLFSQALAPTGTGLLSPGLPEETQSDASARSFHAFQVRYVAMAEAVAVGACLYAAAFVVAGGAVLPIAFGSSYAGLSTLVAVLSLMWALRLVQTVPCMALLASGATRPLLVGGILRGLALAPALAVALAGCSIEWVAMCGVGGEAAAMLYLACRLEAAIPGTARPLLGRALLLVPAALLALGATLALPAEAALAATLAAALAVCAVIALAAMTGLKRLRSALTASSRSPAASAA